MGKVKLKTVYVPNERCEVTDHDLIIIPGGTKVIGEKLVVFRLEEYNKHIEDIINQSLETAAFKVDLIETDGDPDPNSILNTFEETFNKFKL